MRITHGACGKEWTGTSTSHCGGCHETFTSLDAFDRHFVDHQCVDPATHTDRKGKAAFKAVERSYGTVWTLRSDRPNPYA